jgi:hypothetical protein
MLIKYQAILKRFLFDFFLQFSIIFDGQIFIVIVYEYLKNSKNNFAIIHEVIYRFTNV